MYVWLYVHTFRVLLLVSSQKGGHWKRGSRCLSRPGADYPWKGKTGTCSFHWNLWKIIIILWSVFTLPQKLIYHCVIQKIHATPSLMDGHVSWPTPTHNSGNTIPLSHLNFPCKRAPLAPEFPGFSRLLDLNWIYIQKNTCITQSHPEDVIV